MDLHDESVAKDGSPAEHTSLSGEKGGSYDDFLKDDFLKDLENLHDPMRNSSYIDIYRDEETTQTLIMSDRLAWSDTEHTNQFTDETALRGVEGLGEGHSCDQKPMSTLHPSPNEEARCSRSKRKREALDNWYARANEFQQYFHTHHHGNVPQKRPKRAKQARHWNEELANWVNKQRREKKIMDEQAKETDYMYNERVALLERIGFEWAQPKDVFDMNISKLQEFHEIVGHSDVPVKAFDKSKEEKMTIPEQLTSRVDKLLSGRDDIPPGARDRLMSLLADTKFARWITSIRDEYSKWESRKKRLEEIGFNFKIQGK